MTTNIKMKYKAETGNSPYFEKETDHITKSLSGFEFQGMLASEIISALDYDLNHNAGWGVFISDFPKEYLVNDDLKIYTPEYVQWLEEKLGN
jgi:hypothetical protein